MISACDLPHKIHLYATYASLLFHTGSTKSAAEQCVSILCTRLRGWVEQADARSFRNGVRVLFPGVGGFGDAVKCPKKRKSVGIGTIDVRRCV